MFRIVLIVIIIAGLTALVARALINPAMVSNTAVSPSLSERDIILINRAARLSKQPLKRFELVAIIPPYVNGKPYTPDESIASFITDYTGIPVGEAPVLDVRRVIALPGETVVMRKDLGIFIDGKLLDESSYTREQPDTDLFVLADITRHSAYGGEIQSLDTSDAPITVPADSVFVLPDDRKNFAGSERWGFLSGNRIVGTVDYKVSKNGVTAITAPKLLFATEKVAINDDGVRALESGEYTKAIHLFKSALAIDSGFELARDNLSIAYNNFAIKSAGKPEIALDSLHKALFIDPDNELTNKNLAGILKRLGKDASKYEDRLSLAEDAEKHGRTIGALVEYRAAVKLKPNPKALAKVSELEQKCKFPVHAIPEDLVASASKPPTKSALKKTGAEKRTAEKSGTDKPVAEKTADAPKASASGKLHTKDVSAEAKATAAKPAGRKLEAATPATEKRTRAKHEPEIAVIKTADTQPGRARTITAKTVAGKSEVSKRDIAKPQERAEVLEKKTDAPVEPHITPTNRSFEAYVIPSSVPTVDSHSQSNEGGIERFFHSIETAISPKKPDGQTGGKGYRGPPLLKKTP